MPDEIPPELAGQDRRPPHPKNGLNDLSGEEWLYFTKSVITTAFPSEHGHELRKAHGANKPPQLMKLLIEFFTKAGGRVLDPFAGVGGTLIGAALCLPPRECVGVEINRRWIDVYEQVIAQSQGALRGYPMIHGDSLEELDKMEEASFDFVATDPPYNLHLERTMCDGRYDGAFANRRTDYDMRSDDPRDLANLGSYDSYLGAMERLFARCYRVLKPGRYMAVIVRNAYQKGEYIFTHADLARRAKTAGFVPKGEKVWYQAGTRLRPYGYPYGYVPNIAHQHIVILQRPAGRATGRPPLPLGEGRGEGSA
ncbi:MAG: site-specific DNA-methyltransferase [Chloroflexi bacterium]|nr:site-specific DNA-methyltransferase [Chloroflexota bacterium]